MKKKIIFGLSIFALMFFLGGVYIITTTEATIYDLHRLSQLHRTVGVRKDLLLSVEKNQKAIILRDINQTTAGSSGDRGLADIMKKCTGCHRHSSSMETIDQLQRQIEKYAGLTHDIFTSRPGSIVSDRKAKEALTLGNDMITKIEDIIAVTGDNFNQQERDILRRIDQSKSILFILVTIGPFFAMGLAFILVRGVTQPLKSLLDATRKLKVGDLDHKVSGLYGEFGEVAASFNEMAASLKKQMQEMQRTEQLRVCGEMAAGLAHEIRNPLAGMKVAIEVLLTEVKEEEGRDRDVLLKVIEQIKHIELLMKNLLNYARPIAAQPISVNVNKILEKSLYFIEKHPSFVPDKQVIRELDDHLPDIVADPQQLQQVFLNILLNAADATREGGRITIRTRHDKVSKAIAVEICDTGKGIPEELRGRIFQPFFTTKGKGKGTGLGLAVSKRIVEEHGGSISVAGDAAGGAVFRIVLPVKAEDEAGPI